MKYLLKKRLNNTLLKKFESLIGTDLKLFFKKQGFLKDLSTIVEFKKKQRFYFVLIKPNILCSTEEIYSKVKKYSRKEQFNKNLSNSRDKYLEYLSKNRNDLQSVVERNYPSIKKY